MHRSRSRATLLPIKRAKTKAAVIATSNSSFLLRPPTLKSNLSNHQCPLNSWSFPAFRNIACMYGFQQVSDPPWGHSAKHKARVKHCLISRSPHARMAASERLSLQRLFACIASGNLWVGPLDTNLLCQGFEVVQRGEAVSWWAKWWSPWQLWRLSVASRASQSRSERIVPGIAHNRVVIPGESKRSNRKFHERLGQAFGPAYLLWRCKSLASQPHRRSPASQNGRSLYNYKHIWYMMYMGM